MLPLWIFSNSEGANTLTVRSEIMAEQNSSESQSPSTPALVVQSAYQAHQVPDAFPIDAFPLMSLPTELLFMVLRHCVVTTYTITNPWIGSEGYNGTEMQYMPLGLNMTILRISKHLHFEAIKLFYTENIFRITRRDARYPNYETQLTDITNFWKEIYHIHHPYFGVTLNHRGRSIRHLIIQDTDMDRDMCAARGMGTALAKIPQNDDVLFPFRVLESIRDLMYTLTSLTITIDQSVPVLTRIIDTESRRITKQKKVIVLPVPFARFGNPRTNVVRMPKTRPLAQEMSRPEVPDSIDIKVLIIRGTMGYGTLGASIEFEADVPQSLARWLRSVDLLAAGIFYTGQFHTRILIPRIRSSVSETHMDSNISLMKIRNEYLRVVNLRRDIHYYDMWKYHSEAWEKERLL